MKTNSNFSIPRLARFIRFDFMSNLRSYIFRISLIAIIMLLCMILGSIFISGNSFNSGEQYISTISSIASTAFVITIMVSLSLIFEPMKTVGGRINHLMLPASKAEKFVGRLLISTIGIAVAFIMALLVAECVRNVTLLSFGSKYSDVLGFYFPGIMANMADSLNPAFAVVSIHIFNLSAFLLGGALWYNYYFVKTLCVQTILGLFFFIVAGLLSFVVAALLDKLATFDLEFINALYYGIIWAAIAAMWIGAYQLYRHASIINRRFIFKQ